MKPDDLEGVALHEILKKPGAPLGKDLRGKGLSTHVLAQVHDGQEVVFTLGEIQAALKAPNRSKSNNAQSLRRSEYIIR